MSDRDAHWEACRNTLAVARLLAHERRSDAYVSTVARLAVESACRAALAQAGVSFDDVGSALHRLEAPREIHPTAEAPEGLGHVVAAERVIAWVSEYLRAEAPEKAWGF
jgi:hypothetical protein